MPEIRTAIGSFDSCRTAPLFADSTDGIGLPHGLAFDANGNLFVACGNHTIVKLTPGGVGSVFASSPDIFNPGGLAFDTTGNLYCADIENHGS